MAISSKVDFSKSEEVYFINAHCGQTLEVTDNRSKAIKTFICEYKDKVAGAKLVLRRMGKLYAVHPRGTVADYA
jgi:hypothetical protein